MRGETAGGGRGGKRGKGTHDAKAEAAGGGRPSPRRLRLRHGLDDLHGVAAA